MPRGRFADGEGNPLLIRHLQKHCKVSKKWKEPYINKEKKEGNEIKKKK